MEAEGSCEVESSNEGFPTFDGQESTIEFGWETDPSTIGGGGRRRKQERDMKKRNKPGTFGAMGLTAKLYRNVTTVCKFKMPTPIQRKSIPLILQGLDLVGMARTGSGKTAAFLIPILQRLKVHSTTVGARCLIVSPSRELALQTYAVMLKLGKGMGFRTAVIVGGDSISEQFMQLAANPDIVLATPGRLAHLLNEAKDFSLQSVEMVVFDEADRLFELGFADQIKEIIQSMPSNRQTLLFSATMPRILAEFTKSGLHDPEVVRLDTDCMISPDLTLHFFTVRDEDKTAALLYLLRTVISEGQASIVFCSTKHHVAFLHHMLQCDSIDSAFVYGAMDQSARKIQVARFRNGVVSVLLVTDVAARGVDLPLIENVIHYDFPPISKLFVHRSGRTARAGRTGTAYSLLTKNDLPYLLDLHLFLSKSIEAASGKDDGDAKNVFGHLPTNELSLLADVVQRRIHDSEELKGLLKSAENGFKLYLKTRPSASNASVRRAKDLPQEAMHPLLCSRRDDSLLQSERACEEFSRKLKEFRPMVSVFEAPVAHNKVRSEQANSLLTEAPVPKAEGPELRLGAYRDDAFYIPYERGDRHAESGFAVHSKLDNAVMDLMGEDQDGLSQQRRQYHWDRRSKRYICLPQGEKLKAGGKRIRMENGVKITKEKKETGKIYDTWMRNQKTKIQAIGSQEDTKLTKRATGALEDAGKKFKEKRTEEIRGQDEILTEEQIKKKRKIKAQLRWKNQPKDKRNKTRRTRIQKRNP